MLGSKKRRREEGRAKRESGLLPILIAHASAWGSRDQGKEGGEKSESDALAARFFIRYNDYDVIDEERGSADSLTFFSLFFSPHSEPDFLWEVIEADTFLIESLVNAVTRRARRERKLQG